MARLPPLSSGQFRLLRILEIAPVIRIQLIIFDFKDAPEYFALSYAWTTGQTEQVSVDTTCIEITPNLHKALHELYTRNEYQNSFLWIDQICIDQTNNDEKSLQVQIMDQIYASARSVIIWLGPASEDSDLAIDGMLDMIESMPLKTSKDTLVTRKTQEQMLPQDHPVWSAVVKLFYRPWFRRLWTLQEAVLAKDAIILCGGQTAHWSVFTRFISAVLETWPSVTHFLFLILKTWPDLMGHARHSLNGAFVPGFECCLEIQRYQQALLSQQSCFEDLLVATRERQATNPRDHVYGIFGLLSKEDRRRYTIDYSMSYEQSAVKFCKEYLPFDHSYLLLSMAPSNNKSDKLPSWCPDFGRESSEGTHFCQYRAFRAGHVEGKACVSQIKILEDDQLTVSGFRLGVVHAVVQRQYAFTGHDSVQDTKQNQLWEMECRSLFESVSPELSDETQEKYYQLLVAGHFDKSRPVPASYNLKYYFQSMMLSWDALAKGITTFPGSEAQANAAFVYNNAVNNERHRKFFSTADGKLGLGPSDVRAGDVLCVLYPGAPVYVLRFGERGCAKLVGEAYIPGFMDLASIPDEARGMDEIFTIE